MEVETAVGEDIWCLEPCLERGLLESDAGSGRADATEKMTAMRRREKIERALLATVLNSVRSLFGAVPLATVGGTVALRYCQHLLATVSNSVEAVTVRNSRASWTA